MKAITILQPYASLIRAGVKQFETRGWDTKYRGKIAIHAGKKPMPLQELSVETINKINGIFGDRMTDAISVTGSIIAVADLVECWQIIRDTDHVHLLIPTRDENAFQMKRIEGDEILFGGYETGRYAWELKNVTPLVDPIPYRGNQRLWDVPDEIIEEALNNTFGVDLSQAKES